MDHFVCSMMGWLFESRGKIKDAHMYSGGALFINMASTHIDCIFQAHLYTHETIYAKEKYEMRCQDVGIMPQEYISDNGSAFTSSQYTAHLHDFKQIHCFAGVFCPPPQWCGRKEHPIHHVHLPDDDVTCSNTLARDGGLLSVAYGSPTHHPFTQQCAQPYNWP